MRHLPVDQAVGSLQPIAGARIALEGRQILVVQVAEDRGRLHVAAGLLLAKRGPKRLPVAIVLDAHLLDEVLVGLLETDDCPRVHPPARGQRGAKLLMEGVGGPAAWPGRVAVRCAVARRKGPAHDLVDLDQFRAALDAPLGDAVEPVDGPRVAAAHGGRLAAVQPEAIADQRVAVAPAHGVRPGLGVEP